MVVCNELFSPQEYLERVTGRCYIIDGEDDRATILRILQENNKHKRIHILKDVDKITKGKFVLVECMYYDEIEDGWIKELIWCEV